MLGGVHNGKITRQFGSCHRCGLQRAQGPGEARQSPARAATSPAAPSGAEAARAPQPLWSTAVSEALR